MLQLKLVKARAWFRINIEVQLDYTISYDFFRSKFHGKERKISRRKLTNDEPFYSSSFLTNLFPFIVFK